jgi:hypothetical protein
MVRDSEDVDGAGTDRYPAEPNRDDAERVELSSEYICFSA